MKRSSVYAVMVVVTLIAFVFVFDFGPSANGQQERKPAAARTYKYDNPFLTEGTAKLLEVETPEGTRSLYYSWGTGPMYSNAMTLEVEDGSSKGEEIVLVDGKGNILNQGILPYGTIFSGSIRSIKKEHVGAFSLSDQPSKYGVAELWFAQGDPWVIPTSPGTHRDRNPGEPFPVYGVTGRVEVSLTPEGMLNIQFISVSVPSENARPAHPPGKL